MPNKDPANDPINTVAHQPATPKNEPIKASNSKSPWPIPSILRIIKKSFAIANRKKYAEQLPRTAS